MKHRRCVDSKSAEHMDQLIQKWVDAGPERLSEQEKQTILGDANLLTRLHNAVWSHEAVEKIILWKIL